MIKIDNLTKSYIIGGKSVKILKGIDLTIDQGEFVAIMWPSGSGKSTLMNMIGILDTPTTGTYLFNETDVAKFSADQQAIFRREKIWFVFQWYNLLPRMPAWMQVALPLSYQWWSYPDRYQRAVEILGQLWLQERKDHTPDMLSGGQQQRVAIARAVVADAAVLLADEPTGALDSVTSDELLGLFTRLNKLGKTIVMITHDHQVASHARRIIHLKDGLVAHPSA